MWNFQLVAHNVSHVSIEALTTDLFDQSVFRGVSCNYSTVRKLIRFVGIF